jgi:hypothetical protein
MVAASCYKGIAQEVRFRVVRKNEVTGQFIANMTKTQETTIITIQSFTKLSLLLDFTMLIKQADTFDNGLPTAAFFSKTINGKTKHIAYPERVVLTWFSQIQFITPALAVLLSAGISPGAQPYIDLLNTRILDSPEAGISRQGSENVRLNYYNISTTLPIRFKKTKHAIILSP